MPLTLLANPKQLPDPQVAFRLLSTCAGFGKIAFAGRVVPYGVVLNELQRGDDLL